MRITVVNHLTLDGVSAWRPARRYPRRLRGRRLVPLRPGRSDASGRAGPSTGGLRRDVREEQTRDPIGSHPARAWSAFQRDKARVCK